MGKGLPLCETNAVREFAKVLMRMPNQAPPSLPPMPTILMGDLNEWSAARGCIADFARHYAFAPCGRSFHARQPIAQIDRIMHSDALRLLDCGVHHSASSRRASDHLPIWAEFSL